MGIQTKVDIQTKVISKRTLSSLSVDTILYLNMKSDLAVNMYNQRNQVVYVQLNMYSYATIHRILSI